MKLNSTCPATIRDNRQILNRKLSELKKEQPSSEKRLPLIIIKVEKKGKGKFDEDGQNLMKKIDSWI